MTVAVLVVLILSGMFGSGRKAKRARSCKCVEDTNVVIEKGPDKKKGSLWTCFCMPVNNIYVLRNL